MSFSPQSSQHAEPAIPKDAIGNDFFFFDKISAQSYPCPGLKMESWPVDILVAEDEPLNMLLISEVLRNMGCNVVMACNGEEAVAILRHSQPALIFMDLHMPEMDGYEATRAIRQMPGSQKNIPIVALTADTIKEDQDRCLQAGMNHYISKPFVRKRIEEILKYYLHAA